MALKIFELYVLSGDKKREVVQRQRALERVVALPGKLVEGGLVQFFPVF